MGEETVKLTWWNHLRWWLYCKCFAFCVWSMHPEADPAEFSILDDANFIAISRDEIRKIVEEAPEIAWRFAHDVEASQ
jgi:hypothetical protein